MIASLTVYTQDSLRLVPVEAWQLSRLIDDAKNLSYCETGVSILSTTIDSLRAALNASKKLTLITSTENELLTKANKTHLEKADNLNLMHKSDLKQERKRGRKEGLTIGAVLALIAVLI